MKAVIGDLHGLDFWKKVLENKDYTDLYCTGDYWDSYEVNFEAQKRNFLEITEAARRDPRLHLCIGNHELHYLYWQTSYSRFQPKHKKLIRELLWEALPLLKVAYRVDDWVISHAGFSRTFMRENDCTCIEDVQKRFDQDRGFLDFAAGCLDPYGNDIKQGPLWIRLEALFGDMFFSKQIVGHTPQDNVTLLQEPGRTLVLVDTASSDEIFYW